jgi:hypothetical protein
LAINLSSHRVGSSVGTVQFLSENQAAEAAVALWAFLHGFAQLEGVGAIDDTKPTSSFEFGLKAWIKAVAK